MAANEAANKAANRQSKYVMTKLATGDARLAGSAAGCALRGPIKKS